MTGALITAETANPQQLMVRQLGTLPYEEAWDLQRTLHAAVAEEREPPTVLLLEHPPVFTAGRRTEEWERPANTTDSGAPVIDVDRGGKITWHGPGQLVGYPIVVLRHPLDVVAYVRCLERLLVAACADLGVATGTVLGRSGVWVTGRHPQRKVAAIGVRVSRGVTMHGFALNCDADLTWFDRIVPCGIADAEVTSLSKELGRTVTVDEAVGALVPRLREAFPHDG